MEKQVDQNRLELLYNELFRVRGAIKKVNSKCTMKNLNNIKCFLDSYESYLLLKISEEKKILTFSVN